MTVEDIIYKALDAKANITKLSKKYMEGMNERMNEKKITVEKLLELCKKYGTDMYAKEKIANETGCKVLTITTYIQKWGIKAMLQAMEEKDKNKDLKETLKGIKWMEEPLLVCTPHKEDDQKVEKVKANTEELKQEDLQPASPEQKDKPTGRLLPTALRGKDYAYTICETDKTVIISDLKVNQDIEIPFEEFPDFAAELSNFNANYLRRFLS